MMMRFWAKLNLLELKELYLNGRRYTWSNKRQEATLEKIDHIFFCTNSWDEQYLDCFLTVLGLIISDHYPLLMDLHANLHMGKIFKREAFWTKAEGFTDTFKGAWNSIPLAGNPFVVLDKSLGRWPKAYNGGLISGLVT